MRRRGIRKHYRCPQREHNLSQPALRLLDHLHHSLDQAGAAAKPLLVAGDASFCHRTLFRPVRERIDLLCRTRADVCLCRPATAGSRRSYSQEKFTPEQSKKDDSIAWQKSQLWHGNRRRELRYKEQRGVWWQTGAGPRRLRLLVVAPIPYRRTKTSRLYYRRPAFLLTTDLTTPARELLPVYLDGWEIEVNHREEKTTLGVGQAQLWSSKGIGRQPALVVAAYSALLLAGLEAYGPTRTTVYREWPKWRHQKARPSCLDLVTLLRQQWHERPHLAAVHGSTSNYAQMILSAAA